MGAFGTAFALTGLFVFVAACMAVCGMALLKACLIDQTLDFGIALAILLALCCATGGVMMSQSTGLIIGWSFLLVAGCALIQPLGEKANKRGLQRLNNEDIEKYKKALEFDPNNS